MSLQNILLDISADLGIDISDGSPERTLAIVRINQAAQEIYDANDLIGCLHTEVFDPNVGTQQVALPYYVGQIRGIRYYESTSRNRITLQNVRSRFNFGIGNEVWYLKWMLLRNKHPLMKNIDNQSILTASIPIGLDNCFTVSIIGKTTNASRITEQLVFCPGNLSVNSVNNFVSVESIRKSDLIDYDVTITDVDGNIVSMIPNIMYNAYFTLIQVLDFEITNFFSVEILYKMQYFPFKDNDNEFVVGHDKYDKAIFWKYREHEYARNNDIDGAMSARGKCNEVILQIEQNNDSGQSKSINFSPNPYFNMYPSMMRSSWIRSIDYRR